MGFCSTHPHSSAQHCSFAFGSGTLELPGNKDSKEKEKGRGGDKGGVGSEIKGHPKPHTKHFAFDLALDHEGPFHFCTVRGHIMACFLNKKKYNTRNWQILALTRKPEQGSHFQRGQVSILS